MNKSIIGWHYSLGGNKSGIGDLMEKLNQNGVPFLMKGADDAGLCFEGQKKGLAHGVDNYLIYRVSTAGQKNGIEYDVPDYTKSPKMAAQEHFIITADKWPGELNKAVVWMEPINEPRAKLNEGDVQWGYMNPVDWLGEFMFEYTKIANVAGFKVCGPSFNSGEPEVFSTNDYEQPGMLDYLHYCSTNPEKAALSVHCYTWDRWTKGESWPDWYPALWGRVEAAIAAADKHNIPRTFSILMTEWGFAHDNAPRWPECEPYLTDYNEWAARWPQVKGVAAWTLANGWGDVDDDLQSWFGPLGDYAISHDFPKGVQPAKTHIVFGGTLPSNTGEPMPGNNKIFNGGFELGYYVYTGSNGQAYDNIRVPEGFDFDFARPSEPNPIAPTDPNAIFKQPESHVLTRAHIPLSEQLDFFGNMKPEDNQLLKVFWKNGSLKWFMGQQLKAGTYDLSFYMFPDMYEWEGYKVYGTDPDCCIIWVETDQGETDWQRFTPGIPVVPKFRFSVGIDSLVKVWFLWPWAFDNNGAFFNNMVAVPIEEQTMTWKQEAWKLGEQKKVLGFKTGAALQVRVTADGYQALSNEYEFIRPDNVKLVMQRAKHASEGTFRTYYVIPPNYNTIYIIDEATGNPPPNF